MLRGIKYGPDKKENQSGQVQDHSPCSGEARSMKYKIYFDLESECTYGREEEAKNKNERQKKKKEKRVMTIQGRV